MKKFILILAILLINNNVMASCTDLWNQEREGVEQNSVARSVAVGSSTIIGMMAILGGSMTAGAVILPGLAVGGAIRYLSIVPFKKAKKILEQARTCEGVMINRLYEKVVEETNTNVSMQEFCDKIVELDENKDLCQYTNKLTKKEIQRMMEAQLSE